MFNIFGKKEKKPVTVRPTVLLVLDGWGMAPPNDGNAIYHANTPNMDSYFQRFPHGELIASGESVGLPANEVGNTEVGHLTIGAGRVILQDLKEINQAIEDGTFYQNRAFKHALKHAQQNKSNLHLLGLVGTGNVHSSSKHLEALLQSFKKEEFGRVFLHIITDGRDSPPKSGLQIVQKLEEELAARKLGRIASVSGRYYAMDRDRRWERTKRAYDAMVVGSEARAGSALEVISSAYKQGLTDEFIPPTTIYGDGGPVSLIGDNDATIFYNFRIDRPRQLTMAFVLPDFEKLKSYDFGYEPKRNIRQGKVEFGSTFDRARWPQNHFFVTMTEYQKNLPVSEVAFPPKQVETPLSEVLSDSGLYQVHMAESEKERCVTYYFDGLREQPFANSFVDIAPSPKVSTYDKKPEMSVFDIVKRIKKHISDSKYNFYVVNFANPDMVAHSGNIDATIDAVAHTDKAVGELVDEVLAVQGQIFITADHGNAEDLLSFPESSFFYTTKKGEVNTDHSNHPVPFIAIRADLDGNARVLPKGSLSDIAPTVLRALNLTVPTVMKGRNLLE